MTAQPTSLLAQAAPLEAAPTIPFNALEIFLMVAAIVVVIGIAVALVLVLLRTRRQTTLPVQAHGSQRLEITWTIIPAISLVAIFGFMFYEMQRGPTPGTGLPAGQEPDIIVVGHQWWWEFRYPKQGGVITANELHLPTGRQALVALTSSDVQHDFWVPELGQKMDLYPNKMNYLYLNTSRAGTFLGACAEYCGTQHAWMRLRVIVQPQADFDAWIAQLGRAPAPSGALAARGSQLFNQYACGSCHMIAGTEHRGLAAPALTNFGSRETISGGVITNTPDHLARYLHDPQAVKPGILMPNFKLSDDEIGALVAYLEGLK